MLVAYPYLARYSASRYSALPTFFAALLYGPRAALPLLPPNVSLTYLLASAHFLNLRFFYQLRKRPDLFPETGGLTAADGSKLGECHPLELKLLVALRMLGRNFTFDDGAEATSISADVLRKFFLTFVDFYANQVGPNVIEVPRTPEAIADCLSGYAASGLPGFIGSVSI